MPISGPHLEEPVDLPSILQRGLETRPNALALVSLRTGWTWRELEEASSRLAQSYLALGLGPGDRVASLLPNRTVLVIHYIACFKASLVAVPLNYRYTALEIDYALHTCDASALVAHAERADDLDASSEAGGLRCGVLAVEGMIGDSPTIERMIATTAPLMDLPQPDPNAPAFILFTSGSTGKPKGAIHTLKTYGWIVASIMRGMEMTSDDVIMPGSSISHMGSLKVALGGLAVGAKVAVARSFDPDEFLPLLREARPTEAMVLAGRVGRLGARSWRVFQRLRILASGDFRWRYHRTGTRGRSFGYGRHCD